ncbi:MAG: hypothetical protein ACLUEV_03730 [Alistipes sp.]
MMIKGMRNAAEVLGLRPTPVYTEDGGAEAGVAVSGTVRYRDPE